MSKRETTKRVRPPFERVIEEGQVKRKKIERWEGKEHDIFSISY
jgi:hypothetical protein